MPDDDVLAALAEYDPAAKCARVAALSASSRHEDGFAPATGACPPILSEAAPALDASPRIRPEAVTIPGRPTRPSLVRPRDVPTRGLGSPLGRAALVHAVAHIEFNAINLALDAAWRFGPAMPPAFHADWISVAKDEARHFSMLSDRLTELGHAYGDFPAHNGLWEAAEKTAHDSLARMALVPRVLEARGLDVTPGMILRLEEVGDPRTAAILRTILSEEVRHVAIGTTWFRYLCVQRELEPVATFAALLVEYGAKIHEPINRPARLEAGFVAEELPTSV